MVRTATEVAELAANVNPVTVAIIFLGLISLAVVKLAILAIKSSRGKK